MDNRKDAETESGWLVGTGILKTGGKPGTGRVRGNGSNRSTGSGLALVHKE